MARMRYAAQALELIRKEDPETQLTLNHLRALAASGKIPVHRVGNRRLINVDALIEYLSHPVDQAEEKQSSMIRRLPERGEKYAFTATKR